MTDAAAAGGAVPRAGALGHWDRFVGPGATRVENLGSLAAAALGLAVSSRRSVPPPSRLVLQVLAVDLWGGAWCNNTRAAARWYHREGQGPAQHLAFAAAHLHPFVLAWIDRDDRAHRRWWVRGAARYGYLLLATALVTRTRGPARRRAGLVTTALGIVIDHRLGPFTSARWFAPVYCAKLLAGHAAGAALLPGAARAPDRGHRAT